MILLDEYFNNKKALSLHTDNAKVLLVYVNNLLTEYIRATKKQLPINGLTHNLISGNLNGDGGYRLTDSKTGAKLSSHKLGKGIDIFDPENDLDAYITDSILERNYLYREHPMHTPRWCHLTTRSPSSGKRSFFP